VWLDYEEHGVIVADGKFKHTWTVNDRIPGPTIDVLHGSEVVVHSLVEVHGFATSLHWHGVFQKGTPWNDGAAGVSVSTPVCLFFWCGYQITIKIYLQRFCAKNFVSATNVFASTPYRLIRSNNPSPCVLVVGEGGYKFEIAEKIGLKKQHFFLENRHFLWKKHRFMVEKRSFCVGKTPVCGDAVSARN